MDRDQGVLLDLILALDDIHAFLLDTDYESFAKDRLRQSAVLHQLTIMGEGTRRLSESFRKNNDHIPWAKIIGLRNVIVHEYHRVDWSELWAILEGDLPELQELLKAISPPCDEPSP